MKNNLVELTQEEIQEVAGAGIVTDVVNNVGTQIVGGLGSLLTKFSETTQARLNERGNTWLAGLVKFFL